MRPVANIILGMIIGPAAILAMVVALVLKYYLIAVGLLVVAALSFGLSAYLEAKKPSVKLSDCYTFDQSDLEDGATHRGRA